MKASSESEAIMPGLMWPHLRHPREVGAMVEAQTKSWELNQKGGWEAVVGTWPVVTISRELGDQGLALGRSVAQRLGFSYWDRELVMERARLLTKDTTTSSMHHQRTREAIESFLGTSVPIREVRSPDYADQVRLIVGSIAPRGGAVIVGRGAHALLDPRHTLRVRLVAPFELRARDLETREGISLAAARRLILSDDGKHTWFMLHAFGQEVADPEHFDVVVNTRTYENERAVGLVLMAYLAKFGDWPLTARALRGARMTDAARVLTPISPAMPATGRHE